MKLLIPPPIVGLIFAAIIWVCNMVFPSGHISFAGQLALAVVLVALGFSISVAAAISFKKASTQIDPREPSKSQSIVQTGIFRYSRNPMYLGLVFVLVGWVVWLGNWAGVAFIALFIWYISRFQIAPEEEALKPKFGAEYEAYLRKVRRWI